MDETLETHLAAAADRLSAFANGPAQSAADVVGAAFDKAGRKIASALGEAARSGELSVKTLAASILKELSAIAVERAVTAPLQGLLSGLVTGASAPARTGGIAALLVPPTAPAVQGARASGGPVVAGSRYLVGERGPELFTPAATGTITPSAPETGATPVPVTIHINMPQGASLSEARRSSGLVAAALARAVQRGSGLL